MKSVKKSYSFVSVHVIIFWVSVVLVGISYFVCAKYWYKEGATGVVATVSGINEYDTGNYAGRTQLMKAADRLDQDAVLRCLKEGANPNLQSKDVNPDEVYNVPRNYTALHIAILNGAFNYVKDVVKTLLDNGADPHLQDFMAIRRFI
jgi:ankyrin repeat protein